MSINNLEKKKLILYYASFLLILLLFFLAYKIVTNYGDKAFFKTNLDRKIDEKNIVDDINRIKQFYKIGHYRKSLEHIDKLDSILQDSSENYIIDIIRACCYKQLGLYETAKKEIEEILYEHDTPLAHFLMGSIFDAQQEFKTALRHYEKSIYLDKNYYPAYEKIGDIFFYKKEFKQAVHYYRLKKKYIKNSLPDILKVKAFLSIFLNRKAFLDKESFEKQLLKYFKHHKTNRYNYIIYLILALHKAEIGAKNLFLDSSLSKQEKINETVLTYFEKALNENYKRDVVVFYKILYLMNIHNYRDALKEIQSYKTKSPERKRAISLLLGYIHIMNRNYLEAYKEFSFLYNFYKQLNINNSSFASGDRENKRLYLNIAYYYAVCTYDLGRYIQSEKIIQNLLQSDRANMNKDYLIGTTILLANCYVKQNKIEESIRILKNTIDQIGKVPQLVNALANLLLENDPEEFTRSIISQDYLEENKYLSLAIVDHYINIQKYKTALNYITLMKSKIDSQKEYDLNVTKAYLNILLKNYKKALKIYETLLEQGKETLIDGMKEAEIWNNYAYVYYMDDFNRKKSSVNTKTFQKMIEFLKKAMQKNPEDSLIHLNLYYIYRLENHFIAEKYLNQALFYSQTDKDKNIVYLEAALYWMKKDHIKGLDLLKKAYLFDKKNSLTRLHYQKYYDVNTGLLLKL